MNKPLYIAFVALSAAAFVGCGGAEEEAKPEVTASASIQSVRGMAVKVAERTVENRLTVQGSLEAKIWANVAARVAGNLDAIWVDEGDTVVAGETKLFQIDPVSLSNEVVIARQAVAVAESSLNVSIASLESIKAAAKKSELDFDRYERLFKEGRVSANEFEKAETQNAQSEAQLAVGETQIALAKQQVEQAKAQLLITEKRLSDSLIISPITGVVSERMADPGEYIGGGQVVLKIVDLNTIEAGAFIPAQYYARVVPGKTAFRLSEHGRALGDVTVSYKSPVVNTTLRTFEIKGIVNRESAASAAPGMMVDLTIVFDSRKGVGVPSGSVLVRDGKSVVFVVKDGRAAQRVVETGYQNDGYTEITKGLAADDLVIYEGHTIVREGQGVEIVD